MTYKEAQEFRELHLGIAGNYSAFLNHDISALLIAPYDIAEDNIRLVYEQSRGMEGNESALKNLGFFNGSMDVYVIWEAVKGVVEQMRLVAYLAATGQK